MTPITFIQILTPILVPMTIEATKLLLPKMPKWFPLILAPALGGFAQWLDSNPQSSGTMQGMLLGALGVYAREVYDQFRKASDSPPASMAAALLILVTACAWNGCQSSNTATYQSVAAIESVADKTMTAWGAYVKNRAATGATNGLPAREQQVRLAYTTYRAAMNAVYETHSPSAPALDSARHAITNLAVTIEGLIHGDAVPSTNR